VITQFPDIDETSLNSMKNDHQNVYRAIYIDEKRMTVVRKKKANQSVPH